MHRNSILIDETAIVEVRSSGIKIITCASYLVPVHTNGGREPNSERNAEHVRDVSLSLTKG